MPRFTAPSSSDEDSPSANPLYEKLTLDSHISKRRRGKRDKDRNWSKRRKLSDEANKAPKYHSNGVRNHQRELDSKRSSEPLRARQSSRETGRAETIQYQEYLTWTEIDKSLGPILGNATLQRPYLVRRPIGLSEEETKALTTTRVCNDFKPFQGPSNEIRKRNQEIAKAPSVWHYFVNDTKPAVTPKQTSSNTMESSRALEANGLSSDTKAGSAVVLDASGVVNQRDTSPARFKTQGGTGGRPVLVNSTNHQSLRRASSGNHSTRTRTFSSAATPPKKKTHRPLYPIPGVCETNEKENQEAEQNKVNCISSKAPPNRGVRSTSRSKANSASLDRVRTASTVDAGLDKSSSKRSGPSAKATPATNENVFAATADSMLGANKSPENSGLSGHTVSNVRVDGASINTRAATTVEVVANGSTSREDTTQVASGSEVRSGKSPSATFLIGATMGIGSTPTADGQERGALKKTSASPRQFPVAHNKEGPTKHFIPPFSHYNAEPTEDTANDYDHTGKNLIRNDSSISRLSVYDADSFEVKGEEEANKEVVDSTVIAASVTRVRNLASGVPQVANGTDEMTNLQGPCSARSRDQVQVPSPLFQIDADNGSSCDNKGLLVISHEEGEEQAKAPTPFAKAGDRESSGLGTCSSFIGGASDGCGLASKAPARTTKNVTSDGSMDPTSKFSDISSKESVFTLDSEMPKGKSSECCPQNETAVTVTDSLPTQDPSEEWNEEVDDRCKPNTKDSAISESAIQVHSVASRSSQAANISDAMASLNGESPARKRNRIIVSDHLLNTDIGNESSGDDKSQRFLYDSDEEEEGEVNAPGYCTTVGDRGASTVGYSAAEAGASNVSTEDTETATIGDLSGVRLEDPSATATGDSEVVAPVKETAKPSRKERVNRRNNAVVGARIMPLAEAKEHGFCYDKRRVPVGYCIPDTSFRILKRMIPDKKERAKQDISKLAIRNELAPRREWVSAKKFIPFFESKGFEAQKLRHNENQSKLELLLKGEGVYLVIIDFWDEVGRKVKHAVAYFAENGILMDTQPRLTYVKLDERDRELLNRRDDNAKQTAREIFWTLFDQRNIIDSIFKITRKVDPTAALSQKDKEDTSSDANKVVRQVEPTVGASPMEEDDTASYVLKRQEPLDEQQERIKQNRRQRRARNKKRRKEAKQAKREEEKRLSEMAASTE